MRLNFIQSNWNRNRFHKVVIIFSWEIWNRDEPEQEIRINFLFWEFNFSRKNKDASKHTFSESED